MLDISGVDFSLPEDPPENTRIFQNSSKNNQKSHIYIGATGYNMRPWVGRWYPPKTKEGDFLKYYGQQFNTIEHNTTHYRIPDIQMVERWKNTVPTDFRYCPKLPQIISHAGNLGIGTAQLSTFCENILGLGEQLGCCFMQLPPHFSVEKWRILSAFLEVFPRNIPLAVEVRHPSFFDGSPVAQSFFEMLSDEQVAAVITDVAGRRDVCHLRVTAPIVMVRFVGNNLHPTDYQRIRDWAERLASWTIAGVQQIYFFTHEPDNLLAPELAVFAGEVFSEKIKVAICRFPRALPTVVQGTLF